MAVLVKDPGGAEQHRGVRVVEQCVWAVWRSVEEKKQGLVVEAVRRRRERVVRIDTRARARRVVIYMARPCSSFRWPRSRGPDGSYVLEYMPPPASARGKRARARAGKIRRMCRSRVVGGGA